MTGKQRRYLRGLGHHLEPVVQVGKEGLSEPLLQATDQALFTHELIKVKLLEAAGENRHGIAMALAGTTDAELVQVLGRTILLYRRRKEDPQIVLP